MFDTQQSKNDVIDVIMDLTSTSSERFCVKYYHAKFGDNWTTNKGKMEEGLNVSPQPI